MAYHYENLKLEKGMYSQSGRSFAQTLEALDPSENYKGTSLEGLDAFQRQLKRFDIKVKGAGSDRVEKFFWSTESAVLFPEFVSRVVRQGMEEESILPDITATVTNFDGMDYRSIASTPTEEEKKLKRVEEGAQIPQTTIHTQENLVRLHKRGRMLVAPYEAIRFQRLDLFAVTLRQIGAYMGRMHLEDAVKVRVIKELIAMTCRTVEGQALDLGWARDGRYDITPEDYLTMAIHKTAHYSGAVPLAVGAIVGGADDEIVEALRSYGLDTGLAFQIQDDLLNLVGTDEAKKKDFRSDITEGKRTLVVVHALQNAAPEARERLVEILSSKERDPEVLAEAVAIMEETGSIDYARTFAEDLTLNAKARLAGALPPSQYRDLLVSMADWFVNRLK